MSNYDPQAWQVPMREATWESGAPSADQGAPPQSQQQQQQQAEQTAFHRQFDDIDRAYDNLMKNGKLYNMPYRRDSVSVMGGPPAAFQDYGPRMQQQRHSIDYDQMRPHSNSSVQGYYANQRQQSRPSETDQMMQAKRRMAAQRERELRNYHQEQQYNRTDVNVQGRSDGSLSPNTMNEDDRRELIARQHRALYGNEGAYFEQDGNTPRASQATSGHSSATGGRGASPREFGSFGMGSGQPQNATEDRQLNPGESNQQVQKRPSPKLPTGNSQDNVTASPGSGPQSQNLGIFENPTQQSSRTSTSSPGGSPQRQGKQSMGSNVAPIGTRPSQGNTNFGKGRTGTPSQSPLTHGFTANNDRAQSSASNPAGGAPKEQQSSTWGTGSGVWGNGGNNKSVGAVWG